MKRMVNKQKEKNKAKTLNVLRVGACSITLITGIKIVMKSCFADSTCNAFWEYNFPELTLAFLGSMWLAPVFTKQELTSGSRKWRHLPTIAIPKAIYHYMTNTTKQQPTYQLFQNIMRPKNQLVNPPKMTKFISIWSPNVCFLSVSASTLQLWPMTSEAGPMGQSEWIYVSHDLQNGGEWTHPGRQGEQMLT